MRVIPCLLDAIHKRERVEDLKAKLYTAEAMNFAFVGSQYDKQGRSHRAYTSWQRAIEREIDKLRGVKQATIWEKIRRSRRF